MKSNVILGDGHLLDTFVKMHRTWKICLQPSIIEGSSPRPATMQMPQYSSACCVSSNWNWGYVRLWFLMQSRFRHGRHLASFAKPLQGCPHWWTLLQLCLMRSTHSYFRQTSWKAYSSLMEGSCNYSQQNRHLRAALKLAASSQLLPKWYGSCLQLAQKFF